MNNMTFVCPEGHKTVLDEEKSSESWHVLKDPCPECGKKLEIKIDDNKK